MATTTGQESLKRPCDNCRAQEALPFTKYCRECVNRGLAEAEKYINYLTPTTGIRELYRQ